MTASWPPLILTAVLMLVAYLLGSLSGSLLLGRIRGVDIRKLGSGNAGGTNAFRTQGWKFALGVAVIDVGKGVLATWFAQRWAPLGAPLSVDAHGYLAAGLAVVGHVWPLWHGFRGGKGASTLVGGLLVLWPWSIPLLLLVWGGVLVSTGYVGLSTVLAVCSLPLLAWWSNAESNRMWFAITLALFIVVSHRSNLQRLRTGTESNFARARLLHRLYGRNRR
ncbi:MAG: glycerol-3-phosphate 1-O-acyltransferase PlsY [Pseudomonadota bacterium]|nr:glycerol-3-phosphate 1-O-acyltransferase PlsY [Pseudomonadota bacterium]